MKSTHHHYRIRLLAGGVALALIGAMTTGAQSTQPKRPPSTGRANVIQTPEPVSRMAMTDFVALHDKGGALVVDVRSEDAFKQGHVPSAINVPIDDIDTRAGDVITRAGRRAIVTYCSCVNEHTSAMAAQKLVAAGAQHVSALVGGFPAWVARGGQVEKVERVDDGRETLPSWRGEAPKVVNTQRKA